MEIILQRLRAQSKEKSALISLDTVATYFSPFKSRIAVPTISTSYYTQGSVTSVIVGVTNNVIAYEICVSVRFSRIAVDMKLKHGLVVQRTTKLVQQ